MRRATLPHSCPLRLAVRQEQMLFMRLKLTQQAQMLLCLSAYAGTDVLAQSTTGKTAAVLEVYASSQKAMLHLASAALYCTVLHCILIILTNVQYCILVYRTLILCNTVPKFDFQRLKGHLWPPSPPLQAQAMTLTMLWALASKHP